MNTFTADGMVVATGSGELVAERWVAAGSAKGEVILLHGMGQTRHSWRNSGLRFASAGWTTYAVDARGHGDSCWAPSSGYSVDLFLDDLVAVVDAVATGPVVLVGASMGGLLSLLAVGEGLVDARALVLADVSPRLEADGVKRAREFMTSARDGFASVEEAATAVSAFNPGRSSSGGADGLRRNLREQADGRLRWHWDPELLAASGAEVRGQALERVAAAAAGVAAPTMLVRGTRSDVVSADGVRSLLEVIPHAIVREAFAGHMLAGDDSDAFVAEVLGFLDELG